MFLSNLDVFILLLIGGMIGSFATYLVLQPEISKLRRVATSKFENIESMMREIIEKDDE
jgi:gas vesicle protein